jgi:hypothetical protein
MNAHRRLMAMAVTTCAADLFPAAHTAGRGYKGTITAVPNSARCLPWVLSPASVLSSIAKNFFTITLTPPGEAGCAVGTGP